MKHVQLTFIFEGFSCSRMTKFRQYFHRNKEKNWEIFCSCLAGDAAKFGQKKATHQFLKWTKVGYFRHIFCIGMYCTKQHSRVVGRFQMLEGLKRGQRECFRDATARTLGSSNQNSLAPHDEAWIFVDAWIEWHVLWLILTVWREFFLDAPARKLCSSNKKHVVRHEDAWIFIDVLIELQVL